MRAAAHNAGNATAVFTLMFWAANTNVWVIGTVFKYLYVSTYLCMCFCACMYSFCIGCEKNWYNSSMHASTVTVA